MVGVNVERDEEEEEEKNKKRVLWVFIQMDNGQQLVMIQRTSKKNKKNTKEKPLFLFLTNFEVFRAQKLESDPLF